MRKSDCNAEILLEISRPLYQIGLLLREITIFYKLDIKQDLLRKSFTYQLVYFLSGRTIGCEYFYICAVNFIVNQ